MTTYGGSMFTKKKIHDDTEDKNISGTTDYPTPAAKTALNAQTTHSKPNPAASPFPLKGTGAESLTAGVTQAPGSRLHVGKDIHLKGEITACDRLIVEGKVEASMNSNEIEITEIPLGRPESMT